MMRKWIAITLFLLVLLPSGHLAWSFRDAPQLGYFHDDGLYVIAAKSLAQGAGYRISSFPGGPYQTKYPPLYPFLLSLVWRMGPTFPDNLRLALLVSWLWVPVLIVLSGAVFRGLGLGRTQRLVLCGVLALNPVLSFLGANLMAEVMFSTLVLAALVTAETASDSRWPHAAALAAGLLGGAAFLTKTAALPMLLSVPVVFLLRRRPLPGALFLAGMVPFVAVWTVWSRANMPLSGDLMTLYYTNYISFYRATVSAHDVGVMLMTNADMFLRGIGGLILFNSDGGFFPKLAARLLAIVTIAGAVRLARRNGLTQFHSFAMAYSALLLLWNSPPNERFLLPLSPLVLAAFSAELLNFGNLIRASLASPLTDQRIAGVIVSGGLLAFFAFTFWAYVGAFVEFLPGIIEERRSELARHRPAFDWISANVPQGNTIVSYQDSLVYLYAHRSSLAFGVSPSLFYRNRRDAIIREFGSIDSFARLHASSWVYWTNDDYRKELTEEERLAIRCEMDANRGLRMRYTSAKDVVYEIVR